MQEGWTDFDVALATPDMMGVVGRLGRILGPQGKMPNPRSGTITFDIGKAVEEIKAGKIEYRTENRAGLVHVAIGKKSFDERAAGRELRRVLEEIVRAKPAVGEGPLHQDHHARLDDGPRRARRPGAARATCWTSGRLRSRRSRCTPARSPETAGSRRMQRDARPAEAVPSPRARHARRRAGPPHGGLERRERR